MNKLFEVSQQLLQSGVYYDSNNAARPLWADLNNVRPGKRGLTSFEGAEAKATLDEEITYLTQAAVSGLPRAYIGGRTKAWYWTPESVFQIAESLVDTTRTRIVPWGSFAVINNGAERPRLWSNTGTAVAMDYTPFTWAKHIRKLSVFLVAANTSNDKNNLEWCSADDLTDWTSTPENTAGNLFIRDLDGEIMAAVPLGSNLALYSNETLVQVVPTGDSFVIGAHPTMTGVGAWGGAAVCDISGVNFGFGPQGLFRTDGMSFTLLGEDKVDRFIAESIDQDQAERAFVLYNERTNLIEFCYINLEGSWSRIAYDPARDSFWPSSLSLSFGDERKAFRYPLGAFDKKLYYLGASAMWDGADIECMLKTKITDFGSDQNAKLIGEVQQRSLDENSTLTIRAMTDENRVGEWTAFSEAMALKMQPLAEATCFEFEITAPADFVLTKFDVFGSVLGET